MSHMVTKYMTTAIRTLEMISIFFRAGPTCSSVWTRTSISVNRLSGMPIAEIRMG